jgi:hypothetical protein
MRVCIVNIKTGIVENVAEMGGDLPPNCSQPDTPPDGYKWIAHDTAAIGWTFQDGTLIAPPVPAVPLRAQILAQLAEIDRATGSVRWIRELALGTNDIINALRAGPLPNLPPAGTGMAKVQVIEDQAAALRKQLAALG